MASNALWDRLFSPSIMYDEAMRIQPSLRDCTGERLVNPALKVRGYIQSSRWDAKSRMRFDVPGSLTVNRPRGLKSAAR